MTDLTLNNDGNTGEQVAAPAKGTPEYEAALVARAQAELAAEAAAQSSNVGGEQGAVKPDGVPDKFWNQETGQVNTEALLKSYQELEKTLSKGGKAQDGTTGTNDLAITKKAEQSPASKKSLAEFYTKYKESGNTLTEEIVAEFEKTGIDKEGLADYIAGREAREQNSKTEILSIVGGAESYQQVSAWAANNLADDEMAAYNTALDAGNTPLVKLLLKGIYTSYIGANGKTGKLVDGSGNVPGKKGFASDHEARQAMRDPRYKKDPVYTREVEAKVKALYKL